MPEPGESTSGVAGLGTINDSSAWPLEATPALAAPGAIRLTRSGMVVLGLAVGFLACSLNTGTNLLYVLTGMLLSALGVSVWVAHRAVRELAVERRVPREAVQGVDAELSYRLFHRRGKGRVFSIGVEEAPLSGWVLPDGPARICFHSLPPGLEGVTVRCQTRFGRVGRVRLPALWIVSRAPFGLVQRTVEVEPEQSILVLPPAPPLQPGLLRPAVNDASGVARRAVFTSERRDVVRGLRDHRPGDSQRAIHWRSSARRGQLMVKEFERTQPQESLVVLDLALPGPQVDTGTVELLEEARKLSSSLIAQLLQRGERVGLAVAGSGPLRQIAPSQSRATLRRAQRVLARSTPGAAPDLRAVERRLTAAFADTNVFLVTTRAQPPRGALAARARVIHVTPSSAWTFFTGEA